MSDEANLGAVREVTAGYTPTYTAAKGWQWNETIDHLFHWNDVHIKKITPTVSDRQGI